MWQAARQIEPLIITLSSGKMTLKLRVVVVLKILELCSKIFNTTSPFLDMGIFFRKEIQRMEGRD